MCPAGYACPGAYPGVGIGRQDRPGPALCLLLVRLGVSVVLQRRASIGISGLAVPSRRTEVLLDIADAFRGRPLVNGGGFFVHQRRFVVPPGGRAVSLGRTSQRFLGMLASRLGGLRRRVPLTRKLTELRR